MGKKVYTQVRERDLWRCRACGKAELLEVHHITFRSQGGEDTLENLITLCKHHHMAAHRYEISKEELHALREYSFSTLSQLRKVGLQQRYITD